MRWSWICCGTTGPGGGSRLQFRPVANTCYITWIYKTNTKQKVAQEGYARQLQQCCQRPYVFRQVSVSHCWQPQWRIYIMTGLADTHPVYVRINRHLPFLNRHTQYCFIESGNITQFPTQITEKYHVTLRCLILSICTVKQWVTW